MDADVEIIEVGIEAAQLDVAIGHLVVDGDQHLVGRLELLFRGLELLFDALQFLVGRLAFFAGRLELFVGGVLLLQDELQVVARPGHSRSVSARRSRRAVVMERSCPPRSFASAAAEAARVAGADRVPLWAGSAPSASDTGAADDLTLSSRIKWHRSLTFSSGRT